MLQDFDKLKDGHIVFVRISVLAEMMELIHRYKMAVKLIPMGSDVFMVERLM